MDSLAFDIKIPAAIAQFGSRPGVRGLDARVHLQNHLFRAVGWAELAKPIVRE